MGTITGLCRWRVLILALALLGGCQPSTQSTTPPPPIVPDVVGTPDPNTDWAQVLRRLDDAGLSRNDQRTLLTPADIARARTFFPDIDSGAQSTMHAGWEPWIVVHFHKADGTETFVASDYRIYRVDDGKRGDFVIRGGFADYVNRLFGTTEK